MTNVFNNYAFNYDMPWTNLMVVVSTYMYLLKKKCFQISNNKKKGYQDIVISAHVVNYIIF